MPTRGDTQINTFVKGLNTEASPLSFPPNTALDILNFRLQKDGTNVRRLGIDFEDNYLLTATGYAADVLAVARKSFYRWELPNGNSDIEIGIIQIGAKFFFVNLFAESPSNTLLNGGTAIDAGVDPTSRFSFTTINNHVIALSPALPQPYLISYDAVTDVITTETAPIQIRDFWGVTDDLDVGNRPTTLSPEHKYNLLNQGWSDDIITTCGTGINAIVCTFNSLGIYPSNADHWSIGRIEDLTNANVYKYDPAVAQKNAIDVGNVARGHVLLDLYNRGQSRNTATGLTLPADIESGRLTTVAAYAGRAFYAGIKSKVSDGDSRSPILSGTVFFSQVFINKIDLVKCYSEADPTSIDFSDIIDTDGGIIQIPECSIIMKLMAIKESLFVFAQNGIWRTRGDEGGFRATSYQIDKISNIGVYSPDSIVEINGTIYFWGINGIYQLAMNQFGVYETTNITIPTIQRLYDSLPDQSRIQAKAYYDLSRNSIRWLYYSDEAKVAGEPIEYTAPAVVSNVVGTATQLATGTYVEPKVVTLSDTSALVVYRNISAPGTVYARVITINDLTPTIGSEQTLFSATSLQAINLAKLSSSKVLLTYQDTLSEIKSCVLNITGTTVTTTSRTVVNSEGAAVYLTSPIRSAVIDANNVIITFKNTDNGKPSVQVIQISVSDIITFGSVYKSADISRTRNNIVLLSSSKAIISYDSGTRMNMATVDIAGTVCTINTTSSAFPNTTQIPAPTSYTSITTFISKISSSKVAVVGNITTTSPNYTDIIYSFVAEISGTSITSTQILQHTSEQGSSTSNPVSTLNVNNKQIILYRKGTANPFIGRLVSNNVGGSVPTNSITLDAVSAATVGTPEIDLVSGVKVIEVYENPTGIGVGLANID